MSKTNWNRMNEPDGFDRWWKGDRATPLFDSDGRVAFWYRNRVRIRDELGQWETLGYQSIYGSSYFYWLVLSPRHKESFSDYVLDRALGRELIPEDIPKTRTVETQARLQQTAWAKAIKARDGKCIVTGSRIALEACHIKPFAECTHAEAVALDNGVTLTASVHALLDSGQELDLSDPLSSIMDIEKYLSIVARQRP